jgi:hypothetical protein
VQETASHLALAAEDRPALADGLGGGNGPPPVATAPPRRARKILRTVVSVALIVAIFGFALPRFASYRSVQASLEAMT